jgi:hypothetical protein
MQMDVYLKKEQIGTLFVRVGAPEGGLGGGGGGGGATPKIGHDVQKFFVTPPDCIVVFLIIWCTVNLFPPFISRILEEHEEELTAAIQNGQLEGEGKF